jgi:hypothetical protein
VKAKLTTAFQWLLLVIVLVHIWPVCLFTGLMLAALGSRPLLSERGAFDCDGTPVRYQVFSLEFPQRGQSFWFAEFARRHSLDLTPSLLSGVRGWLSPAAVGRLWLPIWQRGLGQWF